MEKDIEIEINSLSEFVNNICDKNTTKTRLYRGQSQNWPIQASIFRNNYSERKEAEIYNIIQKHNSSEVGSKELYLDNLIDMQHYGIPTRLIDWSYNPLVSLYFAVAYDHKHDGKVFMHQIDDRNEMVSFGSTKYKNLSKLLQSDILNQSLSLDKITDAEIINIIDSIFLKGEKTYFIDTQNINDRIRSQQGCFALCIDPKRKYFKYVKERSLNSYILKNKLIDENVSKFLNEHVKDIAQKVIDDMGNQVSESDIVDILVKQKEEYINKNNKRGDTEQDPVKINKDIETFIYQENNCVKSWIKEVNSTFTDTNHAINIDKVTTFKILSTNKQKILDQLKLIGISPISVYPDLKGTIEHIKNEYKKQAQ